MIWRHELKYSLATGPARRLMAGLAPLLQPDRHAGWSDERTYTLQPGYQIRSCYFDDPRHRQVHDKLSGVDRRDKYRLRIYDGQDQPIFLERKIRSGGLSRKESLRLDRAQADALLAGRIDVLTELSHPDQTLPLRFYQVFRTSLLRPVCLVDYVRQPFIWPDGNVRITIDSQLSTARWAGNFWDPDAAAIPVQAADEVILEVKYDHFLPDFIRAKLAASGLLPLALSKYILCINDQPGGITI